MRKQILDFFEFQGYAFDEQGNLILDDIDSIEFVNLIIAMEEEFEVEIPDEFLIIDSIASIGAIESILQYAMEIKI